MFRSLTRGQLVFDLVAPAVAFVIMVVPYSLVYQSPFVLIGMIVPLFFWRLNAGLALGLAWVAAIAQMLAGGFPEVANLAILIVLYATSAHGNRVTKWLGFASTFVGAATVAVYTAMRLGLSDQTLDPTFPILVPIAFIFVAFLALFLVAWGAGLLSKTFSQSRANTLARAVAELERARARVDVVVEQERTRIARDMHDVVAHSLAVVIAQADGARYARHADPAAVDSSLTAISTTAREALADVRVLLGQLRDDQQAGPQPVLDDLDRLIAQVRSSGLDVEVSSTGEQHVMSTGAQLAVYRIVQEALTNALRHADTSTAARLSFEWTPDSVRLTIVSALREPLVHALDLGHGLAGMRERAALAGGDLEVTHDDARFTVAAIIPVQASHLDTGSTVTSPSTTRSTAPTALTTPRTPETP
ncbi:sensor histidine kinase [Marisediminicola sp. LYQ134]|uniref:sensor histidine kinase n=1 Tax=Marisediminicola sp. LYQ134 TaxID=3391061 RepID=UPI003983C0AA